MDSGRGCVTEKVILILIQVVDLNKTICNERIQKRGLEEENQFSLG